MRCVAELRSATHRMLLRDIVNQALHFMSRGTSITLCTANTDHGTVDTMPIPSFPHRDSTSTTIQRDGDNHIYISHRYRRDVAGGRQNEQEEYSYGCQSHGIPPTGQSIPARLFNPTNSAIVIHSGTHIATMESVESPHNDITVASVQPDISPFKKEMLEQIVRQSEEHLTDSQRKQLLQLLECYIDVFADCKEDFGRTNRIQHQIPTGESAPIRQPVRRVPPAKRSETRVTTRYA